VARNLACVIEKHDHEKFDIFAYSNFGSDGSIIRDRIGRGVNQWVNIAALDDLNLAKRIVSDEIDVLIDLNGITKGTRVRVFEYRPAPVQITWNGMPGSLGSGDACDYIIVDSEIVDDVNRDGFDEHFIFMPNGCFPIDYKINQDVAVLREDFGIPEQRFVYATFCTVQKYHPLVVESWAKIAQNAPESLILFLDHGDVISEKIRLVFKENNVDESRLIFLPALSHDSHLKRLSLVDCVLETWPYGAGGTCVDAIRVGTPIVTLRGNHYPSRMGSSVVTNSGLNFLVSPNVESYIDNALSIYNTSRRDGVKNLEIANKIERSEVFNIDKFVYLIEKSYQTAYQNYQNKFPLEDIYIDSNACE
jgi:predicted O-linked N-acetylglucosamine transferase (SPINDLY family)